MEWDSIDIDYTVNILLHFSYWQKLTFPLLCEYSRRLQHVSDAICSSINFRSNNVQKRKPNHPQNMERAKKNVHLLIGNLRISRFVDSSPPTPWPLSFFPSKPFTVGSKKPRPRGDKYWKHCGGCRRSNIISSTWSIPKNPNISL